MNYDYIDYSFDGQMQNYNDYYYQKPLLLSINWKLTLTIIGLACIAILLLWHHSKNESHHTELKVSINDILNALDD